MILFVRNTAPNRAMRAEAGFTLIELMVAVAIFAVGLLGLAALQGEGLRYNGSAYERSQAVILAADMADRIRASVEPTWANPPLYNGMAGGFNNPVPFATCINAKPGCTPAVMAAADLSEWVTSITQALPQGSGSVVCNPNGAPCVANTGSVFRITVSWNGRFGPKSHQITVQP